MNKDQYMNEQNDKEVSLVEVDMPASQVTAGGIGPIPESFGGGLPGGPGISFYG